MPMSSPAIARSNHRPKPLSEHSGGVTRPELLRLGTAALRWQGRATPEAVTPPILLLPDYLPPDRLAA